MAADPRDQLRADRARRAAEAAADAHTGQRDWRHDTLDLDPVVVSSSVVHERTHGGARRAVRRAWRGAPRRLPAGLVVGLALLLGAGAVSAVAGSGLPDVPTAVQPSTSTAPSSVVVDPEVTSDSDGGAPVAAPDPVVPDRAAAPPAPGAGPDAGPGGGPGAGPPAAPAAPAAPAGPGRP